MGRSQAAIDRRNVAAQKLVKDYGDTLWHYTNIRALDGILSNKEIWFGNTEVVNDRVELTGFIDDLEKAVRERISQEHIQKADDIFQQIKKQFPKGYPYIFCLSRAGEDAAQWERYANGGQGVAIVFRTEALQKLLYYNNFIMNEEFYEYNAKCHQLCNMLMGYIQKGELIGFSNLDGLIDNLLLCAMLHKHPSFSPEQEIRIAPFFIQDTDPHVQYKLQDTIRKVYVLNLMKLCEQEGIIFEDLIDSIVIGPRSKQSVSALQGYCRHLGLSDLSERIRNSDCPLR